MTSNRTATIFGAYGHTGRFVVSELRQRGWTPVLSGRDPDKLAAFGAEHRELEVRAASVGDPASLDRALAGSAAVINCAGPFAATASPIIEAALRARIPYLDVAAEIEANLDTFANYSERAREAGIAVLPAMAFYGALGDLLATAALADWTAVDEVCIAYGLSGWLPTVGTRAAGRVSRERRAGRRIVYAGGRLDFRTYTAPTLDWTFPEPLGTQTVVGEFTMADTVTIARHLKAPEIRSYMTLAAVKDVTNSNAALPEASDPSGRSAQTFMVDVIVRSGGAERRAVARGRDIYATTAPIVAEALERVLQRGGGTAGALTAGEIFDARDFLNALAPVHLSLSIP